MADARSSCDAVVLRRGGDHGSFPPESVSRCSCAPTRCRRSRVSSTRSVVAGWSPPPHWHATETDCPTNRGPTEVPYTCPDEDRRSTKGAAASLRALNHAFAAHDPADEALASIAETADELTLLSMRRRGAIVWPSCGAVRRGRSWAEAGSKTELSAVGQIRQASNSRCGSRR